MTCWVLLFPLFLSLCLPISTSTLLLSSSYCLSHNGSLLQKVIHSAVRGKRRCSKIKTSRSPQELTLKMINLRERCNNGDLYPTERVVEALNQAITELEAIDARREKQGGAAIKCSTCLVLLETTDALKKHLNKGLENSARDNPRRDLWCKAFKGLPRVVISANNKDR
jgi:hypothetical protein